MSAALVAPRPIAADRSDALEQIAGGLEGMARGIRLYGEFLERPADQEPRPVMMHTIADAAKILKCSCQHVRDRIRSGALKGFRDGRVLRVANEDLETYRRRRTR